MNPQVNETDGVGDATHGAILFAPSVADGPGDVHGPPVSRGRSSQDRLHGFRKNADRGDEAGDDDQSGGFLEECSHLMNSPVSWKPIMFLFCSLVN